MHCRPRAGLVLLAMLALAAPASAQTTLRFKFEKGQSLPYEMVQEMKMSQQIMGQNIDMNMKQTIGITMTTEELLSDGKARIKTKFNRAKMEMTGPPPIGNLTLDSENPDAGADNPLGKIMGGMIKTMGNMEFTATMNPLGEVSDFKIPEDVVKAFRAMPGGAQFGDMFSEQGLKNMMSQSSLVMPKDPVKPGDTWTQKISTKLPFGKMSGVMKYTYKGTETVDGKKLDKIEYVPDAKIEPDGNTPINIKIDSQKGSGTILWNNGAGHQHSLDLNQIMEMTVGVQNLNLNQKIEQKITMKLKNSR